MTKYPKCQGEMEKGYIPGAWSWISDKKQINPREAKKIFGYGCKNCGYVEFYLREA
jgi:predicted nucleic-acid-binding Zn-ribbon protein